MKRTLILLAAVAMFAWTAIPAVCAVEDFEDGVADYGFTFGNSADTVVATGGNPGQWLNNPSLDTFGPQLRTDYYADDFTGDYRAMGVTTISFDARIDHMDFGYNPIEMSVLLRNTNGTPGDVSDDDYAFYPGMAIPEIGTGWVHYEFAIPSASLEDVPAGWKGGGMEPGFFNPGVTWSDVITSVDRLEIWYWNPEYFGIFQGWDVGVDNITITTTPACPVEDFEDGVADYGLTFGNSADTVEATGGNPGMWLHNPNLDTFGPQLRTDYYAADFTGDYRAMGVTTISFDARIDDIDFGYNPIEMSVLLRNTNGTPGDVSDDDYAFYPGMAIPEIGVGWVHYEFTIPSASLEDIPAGWKGGGMEPGFFNPGVTFSDVITSVDRLEIWYWNPEYFGIFQGWDVGVDNLTICYGGPDFGAALDVTPDSGTLPFTATFAPTICNFDSDYHQYYGQIDVVYASGGMMTDWRHGTVTVPGNDCKTPAFNFNLPAYNTLVGDNTFTLTFESLDTGMVQSSSAVVTGN